MTCGLEKEYILTSFSVVYLKFELDQLQPSRSKLYTLLALNSVALNMLWKYFRWYSHTYGTPKRFGWFAVLPSTKWSSTKGTYRPSASLMAGMSISGLLLNFSTSFRGPPSHSYHVLSQRNCPPPVCLKSLHCIHFSKPALKVSFLFIRV